MSITDYKQIATIGLITVLIGLTSCHEKIDLNQIDKRMETDMGLALPVGSMAFTINDFFGNNQVRQLYIDTMNNKGVLTYCDTFDVSRSFHDIDLAKYISETDKKFKVYDKVKNLPCFSDGQINGGDYGADIELHFPLTLVLNGINKDTTLANERIDSALITNASFISTIDREGFNMDWDWINSVDVVLGDEFTRAEGKRVNIYQKGQSGGWNQEIPILINQFSVCLMKDKGITKSKDLKTFDWYTSNVIDSCQFTFIFKFTVPPHQSVTIDQTSCYKYHFKVNFLDYSAIWGYFKPSNKMMDSDTIYLAEEWKDWSYFQKATLPFSYPRVNLHVTTQLAGALQMIGDFLFVQNSQTQEKVFATFDAAQTEHQRIVKYPELQYLDVEDSQPGDSVTNNIQFSENWREGHIDNLFFVKPDVLGYKFHIDYDKYLTPQARINKGGTNLSMKAIANLPLIFNKGVALSYSDTIKDVDLSQLTLDSLLAKVKNVESVKTSNLRLVLTVNNTLPLRIKGVPHFLDEKGNEIMDPTHPDQPIRFAESDTLYINTPKYQFANDGTAYQSEAGVSTFTLVMDKQHFEHFAKIKQIKFMASIDDETMDYVFTQDKLFKARITNNSSVKLKVGVAANLDAVVNLERSNK